MTTDIERLADRTWMTREGEEMRWGDMTARHLRNCATLIRRNLTAELSGAWGAYSMVRGDMAEYYMEKSLDHLEDQRAEIEALATEMETFAAYKEEAVNALKAKLKEHFSNEHHRSRR